MEGIRLKTIGITTLAAFALALMALTNGFGRVSAQESVTCNTNSA